MGVIRKFIPEVAKSGMTDVASRLPEPVKKIIPSVITSSGFFMTEVGARHWGSWRGVAGLFGTRATDDIDGDTARALDASTKAGAILDTVKDKWDVVRLGVAAFKATSELPSERRVHRRLALGFVAAKHSVNAGLNLLAVAKGIDAESGSGGKYNMFADSIALGMFAISDAIDQPSLSKSTELAGYSVLVASVPMEVMAIAQYTRQLRQSPLPVVE